MGGPGPGGQSEPGSPAGIHQPPANQRPVSLRVGPSEEKKGGLWPGANQSVGDPVRLGPATNGKEGFLKGVAAANQSTGSPGSLVLPANRGTGRAQSEPGTCSLRPSANQQRRLPEQRSQSERGAPLRCRQPIRRQNPGTVARGGALPRSRCCHGSRVAAAVAMATAGQRRDADGAVAMATAQRLPWRWRDNAGALLG